MHCQFSRYEFLEITTKCQHAPPKMLHRKPPTYLNDTWLLVDIPSTLQYPNFYLLPDCTTTQSEPAHSTSSPLSSPALGPSSLASSFFSHPRSGFSAPHISTPFTLPTISSTTSLSTATTIANVITEQMKVFRFLISDMYLKFAV